MQLLCSHNATFTNSLTFISDKAIDSPASYYNRVFGWRAGRAGSERARSCGYLVGGWEGWVGSRMEYSSQMQVGLVRQNLADGAAPAGLAPTKH